MSEFIQYLVSGVALGGVYALVALGFVVIYRASEVFNFAHGEILAFGALMMVYMTLGARLGVIANQSPATLLTDRVGRWLAALIGIGVFFISAAFQFGNNIGVHAAFKEYEAYINKVPL